MEIHILLFGHAVRRESFSYRIDTAKPLFMFQTALYNRRNDNPTSPKGAPCTIFHVIRPKNWH